MQRYVTLFCMLLFSLPVGLSITGCVTKVDAYCNNLGYGTKLTDIATVTLSGQATGVPLAYGQIGQAGAVTAKNCRGTTLGTGSPLYGSSNINLADINPSTGAICAGTWNRTSAGGIPDFTICTPPSGPGTAFITATVGGVSSNTVTAYVHPPISSISIPEPTACVPQNQPGPILNAGTQVFDTNGHLIDPSYLGTITYAAVIPNIVNFNNTTPTSSSAPSNGQTTGAAPGGTVITATVSKVTSSAGYFYTCPPKSIALSINGSTTASVTPQNPQNLTAAVTDTSNQTITGLVLDYSSTQPQEIAVSPGGTLTSAFSGAATVTAICQPGSCNPSPINKIGTFGTGLPVVSNRVSLTAPGLTSTRLWAASPNSQYFTPFDLSTGGAGSPVRLPYPPNSMVGDQTGRTLYFGSYRELMVVSTTTNSLVPTGAENTTVPGVVLAVSPDSTTVVINDQIRQTLYLYTPSTGANTSIGGLATRAAFSPDGRNVYIVGPNTLYVHNSTTGWSLYPISSTQPGQSCTLNNANQNPFCSPDITISVPAVAQFLSGTQTTAHSFCPSSQASPPYYPQAATIPARTDHLAATNDGAHVIGASTTSLVDIEHAPSSDPNHNLVPTGTCPFLDGLVPDPLAVTPLQLTTSFNQLALTGITPTQIDQVLASPNSTQVFITYAATAASGLLPLYVPSTTPGAPGTLTNVQLSTGAQAPIAGVFSPDTTAFFVSTTGDNLIHQVSTRTLTDGQTLDPQLRDANNHAVPAEFLVATPRPTT